MDIIKQLRKDGKERELRNKKETIRIAKYLCAVRLAKGLGISVKWARERYGLGKDECGPGNTWYDVAETLVNLGVGDEIGK